MMLRTRTSALRRAGVALAAGLAVLSLPAPAPAQPAGQAERLDGREPLTDRAVLNLVAAGRLAGYLRHFHPTDAAHDSDWNALLVAIVRAAEPARSPEDLRDRLNPLLAPIAPTAVLYLTGEPTPRPFEVRAAPGSPISGVVAWRHKGLGEPDLHSIYESRREAAPLNSRERLEKLPPYTERLIVDLGGGLSLATPVALLAGVDGRTLPHGTPYRADLKPPLVSPAMPPERAAGLHLRQRATRLAAVIAAWNAVRHFSPNLPDEGRGWVDALGPALRAAAEDAPGELPATLREMLASLPDGLAWAAAPISVERALPVAWDWAEGALVVSAAGQAAPLAPGDVVETIDGAPAAEAASALAQRVPGSTPEARRAQATQALLLGPADSAVALGVRRRAGRTSETIELRRSVAPGTVTEPRPDRIAEIAPNTLYLDVSRLTETEIADALKSIGPARGLVFDLRGSESALTAQLGRLSGEVMFAPRQWRPVVLRPDQQGMVLERLKGFIAPKEPRHTGKAVFVVDRRTRGSSELDLRVVRDESLGVIVGEATAGAPGQPVRFALPGGAAVSFNGLLISSTDNERLNGQPVRPDVAVERTIAAVAAGRDEALLRAVDEAGR